MFFSSQIFKTYEKRRRKRHREEFKNIRSFFFWVCSFSLLFIVSFEWRGIPKFLIYILINIVNESFFSHRAQFFFKPFFSMSLVFKRLQVCFPLYKTTQKRALLCFDALRVSLKWERFVEWKSILYCWCWVVSKHWIIE